MKTTIVNQSDVQDAFRAQFLLYSVDVNGDAEMTDFQGRSTTEKAFAFSHRVRATPTLLFFDLDGKLVARHTGPTQNKAEFLLLAKYVTDGAYATQSFTIIQTGQMNRLRWAVLLACALSTIATADRLTLEEALAAVTAAHPDRRMAESELAIARADRDAVASRQDFSLYLDGALRTGHRPWETGNPM